MDMSNKVCTRNTDLVVILSKVEYMVTEYSANSEAHGVLPSGRQTGFRIYKKCPLGAV